MVILLLLLLLLIDDDDAVVSRVFSNRVYSAHRILVLVVNTTLFCDRDDDDATTGEQVLLYSHPSSQGKEGSRHRKGGTVWISNDEAESWNPFYHATEKEVGFAYSCLTETFTSKIIGLLYETEDADSCTGPSCKIVFTTFELPS